MNLKNREDIFNGISQAIRQCLNTDIEVKETDRLVEDLQFDSLHIATLTFCIEEILNCSITLNEWIAEATDSSQLTVSSLVDFVQNNMHIESAAVSNEE